ncbi:MAG: GNAT family protein [Promethearchaeota archaeon]
MLAGKLVRLVPLRREYLEKFVEWLSDPEVTRYLKVFQPITMEYEEEWYERGSEARRAVEFRFAILPLSDDDLVGNCAIVVDWKNRVGTVGLLIGRKDLWGSGLGTEALSLLVEYGFATLGMHRVQLEAYEENARAMRVYQKVGFVEEGRRREALFSEDKFHDAIVMGLLHRDWRRARGGGGAPT